VVYEPRERHASANPQTTQSQKSSHISKNLKKPSAGQILGQPCYLAAVYIRLFGEYKLFSLAAHSKKGKNKEITENRSVVLFKVRLDRGQ
jgi:hypothetical protein